MAIAHPPIRAAWLVLAGLTLGCGNVSPQAPASAASEPFDPAPTASYSVQQLAAGRLGVRRQCRQLCRRVSESRGQLRRCTRLCERTFRGCARGGLTPPGFSGPADETRSPDLGGQEPDRENGGGQEPEREGGGGQESDREGGGGASEE